MTSHYPRKTLGHVLHHLREWGIPETIAGTTTFRASERESEAKDTKIYYGGHLFAEYKYFDTIEQPLFRWHVSVSSYYAQQVELQRDGSLVPKYRLSLGPEDVPALVFLGSDSTKQLRDYVQDMVSGEDDAMKELQQACLPALLYERGTRPSLDLFMVLFHQPSGAQAFVDYLNANFKPTSALDHDAADTIDKRLEGLIEPLF